MTLRKGVYQERDREREREKEREGETARERQTDRQREFICLMLTIPGLAQYHLE